MASTTNTSTATASSLTNAYAFVGHSNNNNNNNATMTEATSCAPHAPSPKIPGAPTTATSTPPPPPASSLPAGGFSLNSSGESTSLLSRTPTPPLLLQQQQLYTQQHILPPAPAPGAVFPSLAETTPAPGPTSKHSDSSSAPSSLPHLQSANGTHSTTPAPSAFTLSQSPAAQPAPAPSYATGDLSREPSTTQLSSISQQPAPGVMSHQPSPAPLQALGQPPSLTALYSTGNAAPSSTDTSSKATPSPSTSQPVPSTTAETSSAILAPSLNAFDISQYDPLQAHAYQLSASAGLVDLTFPNNATNQNNSPGTFPLTASTPSATPTTTDVATMPAPAPPAFPFAQVPMYAVAAPPQGPFGALAAVMQPTAFNPMPSATTTNATTTTTPSPAIQPATAQPATFMAMPAPAPLHAIMAAPPAMNLANVRAPTTQIQQPQYATTQMHQTTTGQPSAVIPVMTQTQNSTTFDPQVHRQPQHQSLLTTPGPSSLSPALSNPAPAPNWQPQYQQQQLTPAPVYPNSTTPASQNQSLAQANPAPLVAHVPTTTTNLQQQLQQQQLSLAPTTATLPNSLHSSTSISTTATPAPQTYSQQQPQQQMTQTQQHQALLVPNTSTTVAPNLALAPAPIFAGKRPLEGTNEGGPVAKKQQVTRHNQLPAIPPKTIISATAAAAVSATKSSSSSSLAQHLAANGCNNTAGLLEHEIDPIHRKPPPNYATMSAEEKRRYERNIREQQRSFRISQQIKELRQVLTESNIPFKPNKFSILLSVAEYIKQLQSRAILLDAEHRKLVTTIKQTSDFVNSGKTVEQVCGIGAAADSAGTTAGQGGTASQDDSAMLFVQGLDYKQVFLQCSAALSVAALDGRILACNREFAQVSGIQQEELQRQSVFNLMQNHEEVFRAMGAMLSQSSVNNVKQKAATQNGTIDNNMNPTSNNNGDADGHAGMYWSGIVNQEDKNLFMNITLTQSPDGRPRFFNCALTATTA